MGPLTRRGAVIAYVLAVAAAAATAFAHPDATFGWAEAAAIVLTLPAFVVALPCIYLGGAAAWNVTGADSGGPMWPVTVVYILMFTATAVANLVALGRLQRRRRRRAPGHRCCATGRGFMTV